MIATRPAVPADHAFVYATWLRAMKQGSMFGASISAPVFFEMHHHAIERLLKRGAMVTVAHPAGEPDTIIGYIVDERAKDVAILHWVYVKGGFRRMGVGEALLAAVGLDNHTPFVFTQATRLGEVLAKRRQATYVPYLFF